MLLSLGYHVTARENGALAYDVFAARPDDFDLVLTDLTMPGGTGLELAGRILAARPDIPILLYTGHSDLITPTKAKEIGIQDVLTKPLSKHKLALAVRRALDRDK